MIGFTQSLTMKKLILVLSLAVLGCSFPARLIIGNPTQTPTVSLPPASTQTPIATPDPGTVQNPLLLALSPAERTDPDAIAAGEKLAALIQARTGYRLRTVAPSSEAVLVDALKMGNAHIAALPPFAYLLARENNSVTVILSSARDGQSFYGTQFIANRESEFQSFYDSTRNENTASAEIALRQFEDKKPCWSDPASPSGYVIPLGVLTQSRVKLKSPAFLAGQVNVVRAVYSDDICDFGATFVDARDLPLLEADYPDVFDRVIVIWRVPDVIPYENISVSNSLPFEMRRVLQRAFLDLMLTPEGKSAMQILYGMESIQAAEDSMYDNFSAYFKASNLNLLELVR